MGKSLIRIDVVSDVVCPWCYIGKRRLEKALDHLKDDYFFDVHYLPFELNPNIPKEGFHQKAYLSRKFGGVDRYEEITAQTTAVAAQEGLNFNFKIQPKSPNTFDAHRVIWLAEQYGQQQVVVEALFSAYFEKGIDLTDTNQLIEVAVNAGLDRNSVTDLLKGEIGTEEVRSAEAYNRNIGVTGVPFYIINHQYTLSGAQPPEVFIRALSDIGKNSISFTDESCDIEGNC